MSTTDQESLDVESDRTDPSQARSLIERAARGHTPSIRALIARLLPVIQARVRRQKARHRQQLSSFDEGDLIQDVWMALWKDGARQLLQWDEDRGATLEGYVGMISEREIGNLLQRVGAKKRQAHLVAVNGTEPTDPRHDPERRVIDQDLAEQLLDDLTNALPAKGIAVLRYLYTDDLQPDEVADVMGVSRQAVYNWRHKIRQLARDFLMRLESEPERAGGTVEGDP